MSRIRLVGPQTRVSELFECDFDQRAVANHPVNVVALPDPGNVRQDLAALGLVLDDSSCGGQIGPRPSLQMKCEMRICLEVEQPLALSRIRSSADVDPSADVVEHDLEPARPPGTASLGRDVDRVPPLERSVDRLFGGSHLRHRLSPKQGFYSGRGGFSWFERATRLDVERQADQEPGTLPERFRQRAGCPRIRCCRGDCDDRNRCNDRAVREQEVGGPIRWGNPAPARPTGGPPDGDRREHRTDDFAYADDGQQKDGADAEDTQDLGKQDGRDRHDPDSDCRATEPSITARPGTEKTDERQEIADLGYEESSLIGLVKAAAVARRPQAILVLDDQGDHPKARSSHAGECRGSKHSTRVHPSLTIAARMVDSDWRCRPSLLKFCGESHASNAARRAGHSASVIEYQAVSRLRPLTTMCWRNTPSKVKPKRSAARRDAVFSALHFHSYRRLPRSNAYRDMR